MKEKLNEKNIIINFKRKYLMVGRYQNSRTYFKLLLV